MKRNILLLTILFVTFVSVFADNVQVTLQCPERVEVGETFRVQYTVNTGNVSDFINPKFPGLKVVYGPSESTMNSVQIINGVRSANSAVTISYILVAPSSGTYTIGAGTAVVGGRKVSSRTARVQAVGSSSSSSQYQSQPQQRSVPSSVPAGKDLFMTATASRTNVFEQEAVLLTYKIYSLVNLTQLEGKLPTLDGFQIHEIAQPRNKHFGQETYNGRMYKTVVWNQYVVYPQKTGKLVIPSITYEGIVPTVNRNLDPIDAMFNGMGGVVETKRNVVSPSITINVSPLPEKPDDYCGAVGRYSMSSNLSATSVKTNDAVTLTVTVNGTGNMKLMGNPHVEFPKDFETYDPKITDNQNLTNEGLTGSRSYAFVAVPRREGTYKIPAATFVYFDTDSKTYKTLRTEPYTIQVEKGSSGGSSTDGQQYVEELNQDIRYIKTGNSVGKKDGAYYCFSFGYLLSFLIPLFIFAGLVFAWKKRLLSISDVVKQRGKRAGKLANKRLKLASQQLAANNQEAFYDEVLKALWGYAADKLNMPQEHLNKDNIQSEMESRGVTAEFTNKFISLIGDCEFARYAPGDAKQNMENIFKKAVAVISESALAIAFALILGTSALPAMAVANIDTLPIKEAADTAYVHEDYNTALQTYLRMIEQQGGGSYLFYNVGNCYYKLADYPKAVLYYERALRLDPADSDIRHNLELVYTKIEDKPSASSEMFFVTWWRSLSCLVSTDAWAISAVVAFIIALLGIFVYLAIDNQLYRRIGAYGAIALAVYVIMANLLALTQYTSVINKEYAVVMSPEVTVKSSPSDSGTELFVIHAGTKVQIIDETMQQWREVQLPDGKVGWISTTDIEEI